MIPTTPAARWQGRKPVVRTAHSDLRSLETRRLSLGLPPKREALICGLRWSLVRQGATANPPLGYRIDRRPVRLRTRKGSSLPTIADQLVPVVVNRSTCRHDLPEAVMTITIPDISYSCPVYAGGQSTLNSGAATLISDASIKSALADRPGGAGLLWIAGHRVSHGGAFAAIPNLADGALITVSDGTHSATYRVVGRAYVTVENDRVVDADGPAGGEATLDSIIRADHGGNRAARLLLQTCDGDTHRWMIYADLVTNSLTWGRGGAKPGTNLRSDRPVRRTARRSIFAWAAWRSMCPWRAACGSPVRHSPSPPRLRPLRA